MSIDTPLPCPFCGAEAEMRTSHVPDEWAARIQCTDCGTEKFGRDYFEEAKAKANALASWNRRAPVPALASTQAEKGFLTSEGRFVNRVQARQIAYIAGQEPKTTGNERDLYSEDLW